MSKKLKNSSNLMRCDVACAWLTDGPLLEDLSRLVKSYAQEFKGLCHGVQFQIKRPGVMVVLGNDLVAFRIRSEPIQVFDMRSGTCVQTFDNDAHSMVYDGTQLITCSYDLTVRTWDISSGQCTSIRRIKEAYETVTSHGVYHLTMLTHGQLALRAENEGVRVWDLATGFERCRIKLPQVRDVLGLPDGRLVAGADHLIHVYRDDELLFTRRCHKKSIVTKLQTVGARFMASGGRDLTINIWVTDTMTCVRAINSVNPNFFAVLQDGNLATVSTGKERRLQTFDLDQEGVLARADENFSSVVCGLRPLDNGHLVSFHLNGDVYIWS